MLLLRQGHHPGPEAAQDDLREYLVFERAQPDGARHEFRDGEVFAMAGVTRKHSQAGTRFATWRPARHGAAWAPAAPPPANTGWA